MSSSNQLTVIEPGAIEQPQAITPKNYLAPMLTVAQAVAQAKYLEEVVSNLLIPAKSAEDFAGADYGLLPGTKERSLFQNGAEKLAKFFGLIVDLSCQDAKEDWDGGFFFYRYAAHVIYGGQRILSIERSCHTREDKYAWVWVERPQPDKATQETMKADKRGRNRQVYKGNSRVWVWQERAPNPDPYSLQFVVQAMAQKRAYVAAVKKVLAATGFFSKEIDPDDFPREEMPLDADDQAAQRPAAASAPKSNGRQSKPQAKGEPEAAPVSPEEQAVNNALIAFYSKQKKSEAAGKAFFEGVWSGKPFAEREAEARKLNLDIRPASPHAPAAEPSSPETEPAQEPSAEDDPLKAKARADVETGIAILKEKGKGEAEIKAEISMLCNGENNLDKLSRGDLEGVAYELSKWIASIDAKNAK